MHIAIIHDNIELLKILINIGGNINAKDYYQSTLLHIALQYSSRYEIINWLIEHGATLHFDTSHITALRLACEYCSFNIIMLIINTCSNISTDGHYALLRLIINNKLSITEKFQIIEYLINAGAKLIGEYGDFTKIKEEQLYPNWSYKYNLPWKKDTELSFIIAKYNILNLNIDNNLKTALIRTTYEQRNYTFRLKYFTFQHALISAIKKRNLNKQWNLGGGISILVSNKRLFGHVTSFL